jgi:hypothetical protein
MLYGWSMNECEFWPGTAEDAWKDILASPEPDEPELAEDTPAP